MARGEPMIHVRVTDDLKERLEAKAKSAGRSMNAEIIDRLQRSLDESDGAVGTLQGATAILDELREVLRTARELAHKIDDNPK